MLEVTRKDASVSIAFSMCTGMGETADGSGVDGFGRNEMGFWVGWGDSCACEDGIDVTTTLARIGTDMDN